MRNKYFYLPLFVLISVLMVSVGTSAQVVEPPDRPGRFEYEPGRRISADQTYEASPDNSSPDISLGKVGLSYSYIKTFGVSESPYLADNKHFERPKALAVDSSQNVYIVDEDGSRIHKFNKNGVHQWVRGIPGMHYIEEGVDVFNWPRDVGVDRNDNIWVVDGDRVIQYDSSGAYQKVFPDWPDRPWRCDDDNGHLCWPGGIAFDSNGADYMYVSDSDNHRVQVFEMNGTLTYSTTIGVTGEADNDDTHFNYPGQLAVDSDGNLYVADRENARIQKCTYSSGWTCSTFHGTGDFGDGDDELEYVEGIGIYDTTLYIADSGNHRVKDCDVTKWPDPCDEFATDVPYPMDVEVLNASTILVIHENERTVNRYNVSGNDQGVFAGTLDEPYKTDNKRLNRPWGLAVGMDGSLYVGEQNGKRLVKMKPDGSQVDAAWPIGEPGISGNDNYHFEANRGNLAVDAKGQILIADMYNHRVQVYDPSGNHIYTIGVTNDRGDDNSHFYAPAGVAVSPVNGDIYVADRRNHRVQVFKSNYQYKATLGQTGNPGTGNYQFEQPFGVFVDKDGDVYVADRRNHRVQIFNKNLKHIFTLGDAGNCDWGFEYICAPNSVIVDGAGRIFITDSWDQKVRVFDKDYQYLTMIGGSYEASNGDFREPGGLALDKGGNLYVADTGNHRVQKFAPFNFGWQQSNLDGFGEIANIGITELKSFNPLVAGTFNDTDGAELWKMENGNWTSLMKGGFGHPYNEAITELEKFKGKYYAGTYAPSQAGEIYRSGNLTSWDRVVKDGFGDVENNEISSLAVFKDMLYASTWRNDSSSSGGQVWRSSNGNSGSWSKMVNNGFGDSANRCALSLTEFKGMLYATSYNETSGCEVWRSGNGKNWSQVNNDGFGNKYNRSCSLAVYTDYLYAGTRNSDQSTPGGELYRCMNCDGSDWKKLTPQKGFGDPNNQTINPVGVPGNSVYAFTDNRVTGMQIWLAKDGENFTKLPGDGFGDVRNYFPSGIALHENKLYVGTFNWGNAAEIWQRKIFGFLPILMKD